MLRLAGPVGVIALFGVSVASAATFYPEKSGPTGKRELAALVLPTKVIRGVRYVAIDDMLFRTTEIPRNGFSARRWPGGRVIYDASDLAPDQVQRFREACAAWERRTKIRCVERTTEKAGYVKIRPNDGAHGSAIVGYPGPNAISEMDCCLDRPQKAAHELGHVLGMAHEHMRPDRADFVSINWDNIRNGAKSQFRWRMKMDAYGEYDLLSVMHYTQSNFSKNGQPTIIVLPPNEKFQSLIGEGAGPSELDIAGMNQRYP